MLLWQTNKQLKRVLGGKRVELPCSGCLKKSMFYESEIEENFKLYFVVELWKSTKRILQCGACQGICDYYEIFPQEKLAEEAAKAERERKAADAAAQRRRQEEEQEQKRKFAEAQELKRKADEEQILRESERRRKEAAVEDELAKLKKRVGK